jgi:phosphoglycolate phosphatase-like HAD superfamily hydrolase
MHLVMFDIDGTLTQTDDVDGECYAQAVEEVLNTPPIDRDWSTYRHVTDSGIASEIIRTRFGRDPREGELESIKNRFVERLREALDGDSTRCLPVTGASRMLTALTGRLDLFVALATGGWRQSALLKLATAGFHLDGIILATSDDSICRKQIMSVATSRAVERNRMEEFDRLVYVGDGVWDLRASQELGIRFIAIANGERAEILRMQGAKFVLPDFEDYDRFLALLTSSTR